MAQEFLRVVRLAVRGEIARTGAEQLVHLGDRAAGQPFRRLVATRTTRSKWSSIRSGLRSLSCTCRSTSG